MQRLLWWIWVPLVCLLGNVPFARATLNYQLEVFNGDVPELNMYVQVVDGGPGLVDFVFYNQSTIESSMARIYFDDDAEILSAVVAIQGEGTSFHADASPGNLPGGRSLNPIFDARDQFTFAALAPPPKNGINPGERTVITFNLSGAIGLDDVAYALGGGMLRMGVHVIALPDGSSASAVNIPLPATAFLFGFGAVLLRSFRPKTRTNTARLVEQRDCLDFGGKR